MAYILYEGPSELDGKPVVVIMTGIKEPSRNQKTGSMAQVYILRSDIPPIQARQTREDYSICGDCVHRSGTCYVNLATGPTQVYKSYLAGKYKSGNLQKIGFNRSIRIGAYGDPSACPLEVWEKLLSRARMWTGYTHQPLTSPGLMKYVQASADTPAEAVQYQALGWKTFRIKTAFEPVAQTESLCPSNKGLTCITCGLCNGQKKNISIDVHGLKHKIKTYNHWRLENETKTL